MLKVPPPPAPHPVSADRTKQQFVCGAASSSSSGNVKVSLVAGVGSSSSGSPKSIDEIVHDRAMARAFFL